MTQVSLFENDAISIVQEKKKYANFTIREIGGPDEIIAWRKQQAEKEAANLVIRQQLVDVKKLMMFGPDAPEGDGVTWKGNASVSTRGWEEKYRDAKKMRKDYMKPEILPELSDWHYEPIVEPKRTLFQKFKGWISSIWKSANF